jgi:hypothetical protein
MCVRQSRTNDVNKQAKNRKPSNAATLLKPAESGNPAGRSIGLRNKFSQDVIEAFAADWAADAIARVGRKQAPAIATTTISSAKGAR